jgi:ribonucleoside-diphosphate reductase alpha chain
MIQNRFPILEDLEVKRILGAPASRPSFDWTSVADGLDLKREVVVKGDDGDSILRPGLVAQLVGDALAGIWISKGWAEFATEDNKRFVRSVVLGVMDRLKALEEGHALTLSTYDLSVQVEAELIAHDSFEVAKALVLMRGNAAVAKPTQEVSLKLIRRNGKVVPWNDSKIEVAVRKAFLSLKMEAEPAVHIAQRVTARAQELGQAYISIERVQDLVQQELMLGGYFKPAEAYIVYRAERAMIRAQKESTEVAGSDQMAMILLKQPDGSTTFWDADELRKRIEFALIGLELDMQVPKLMTELLRSVVSDISPEDLRKTIILNAKTLIERDVDYHKFAARILLSYVYEEALGWDVTLDGVDRLKELHSKALLRYIPYGVEIDRLAPDMVSFDLPRLAEALDPSADLDFDYLGVQTLYDRYLITDKTGRKPRRLETPQLFWMRVSMGLFRLEQGDREARIIELYNLYKSRRFCSSTPTLFNSGTPRSQLSSCYLYKVDDSIESIMLRGIAENAFLSKWAGGLGGSWTAVRGTGGYIKGTNGESQGVIPFLKMHNDQLVAVNQGGKRAGSGCAYLESWHNDIFDFLELRRNTGDDRRRTHDMNTANWIPDLFMKRMEAREQWTLFRANETPDLHDLYGKAFEERYCEYEAMAERGEIFGQKIEALDLWKAMLKMLFETGHPWITFKDPCNLRSPQDHVGVIHSSNLCTEITLNTSADETAVCNLGSVLIDSHLQPSGDIDHDKLRETVRIAVRALDNVIDINYYPTEAARRSNLRHRPVGMGVMGLHHALFMKGINFNSPEAVEFNDEFMEAIALYAYEASSDLAAERGLYETYRGSKWDRGLLPQDTLEILEEQRGVEVEVPRGGRLDWTPVREKIARQGMRNSNVLAIAPTATIANIMGTSPCIEPLYKNMYVKSNLSGDFVILNPFLVKDLKGEGLWTEAMREEVKYFDGELDDIEGIPMWIKEKYKSAFGIPYQSVIDAAARRQKWIDQAQSVNLFLGSADLKTLSHMYRHAWHVGLKTTYYLRTLGASNIEKATVSKKKDERPKVELPLDPPTPSAQAACRLDAMMNGGECEVCQ